MAKWVVALFMMLTACASPFGGGGDGVLDCGDEEVEQSSGVTATGVAEAEVAKVALKGWAANGAKVRSFPEAGTWSAVQDGEDLAVARPEMIPDGSWVVSNVEICGTAEEELAADGILDCEVTGWSFQGRIEDAATGVDSTERALKETLGPFKAKYGGEIVIVNISVGALVVDHRERVIAVASELDDGTWAVLAGMGCPGYGDDLTFP